MRCEIKYLGTYFLTKKNLKKKSFYFVFSSYRCVLKIVRFDEFSFSSYSIFEYLYIYLLRNILSLSFKSYAFLEFILNIHEMQLKFIPNIF